MAVVRLSADLGFGAETPAPAPASGYEPLAAGVAVWAKHLIAPTITLVSQLGAARAQSSTLPIDVRHRPSVPSTHASTR